MIMINPFSTHSLIFSPCSKELGLIVPFSCKPTINTITTKAIAEIKPTVLRRNTTDAKNGTKAKKNKVSAKSPNRITSLMHSMTMSTKTDNVLILTLIFRRKIAINNIGTTNKKLKALNSGVFTSPPRIAEK